MKALLPNNAGNFSCENNKVLVIGSPISGSQMSSSTTSKRYRQCRHRGTRWGKNNGSETKKVDEGAGHAFAARRAGDVCGRVRREWRRSDVLGGDWECWTHRPGVPLVGERHCPDPGGSGGQCVVDVV